MDLKTRKKKGVICFGNLAAFRKLYNITMHIYSSTGYIKEFEKLAKRKILLNNCIKWNNWYFMLSVTIQKNLPLIHILNVTLIHLKMTVLVQRTGRLFV